MTLMLDDYNHRWTFIRKSTKGIYVFFKVLLYEIPRFLFIDGPWEIIKATSREAVSLYRAIPPVNEWPNIISRAVISMAKGIWKVPRRIGKGTQSNPQSNLQNGKIYRQAYLERDQSNPSYRQNWCGKTLVGRQSHCYLAQRLFLLGSILFIDLLIVVFCRFYILSSRRSWISSARLPLPTLSTDSRKS